MKHKLYALLAVFLVLALGVSSAQAEGTVLETGLEEDYPWRFHAEPMGFKFGNMLDSHQQSFLDSRGVLHGFIYIYDTGQDTVEGYPIAEKAHCPTGPCMVGWVIKGVKIHATLVNKSPRIWLIDPGDIPVEPGYSHFHWLGGPHSPGGPNGLVVGQEYEGYLMKRIAPRPFFWLGGPGQGGSGGGCSGGEGGGCSGHEGEEGGCSDGGEGGCSGSEGTEGGCSGGSGGMEPGGSEGGCSDGGEEGGCSGSEGTEGGCSGGSGGMEPGGSEGGCTDGSEGGCSGSEGGEGGCSGGGGEMGGGSSGRLVTEGIDAHSNVVTLWDGTWQGGGGCHD